MEALIKKLEETLMEKLETIKDLSNPLDVFRELSKLYIPLKTLQKRG